MRYGGITDLAQLWQNLAANSIPEAVCTMTVNDYDDFLAERRRLMAHKMRELLWQVVRYRAVYGRHLAASLMLAAAEDILMPTIQIELQMKCSCP